MLKEKYFETDRSFKLNKYTFLFSATIIVRLYIFYNKTPQLPSLFIPNIPFRRPSPCSSLLKVISQKNSVNLCPWFWSKQFNQCKAYMNLHKNFKLKVKFSTQIKGYIWLPICYAPLEMYSCNEITTTQIQISRQNWNGFFSNISHQMMI